MERREKSVLHFYKNGNNEIFMKYGTILLWWCCRCCCWANEVLRCRLSREHWLFHLQTCTQHGKSELYLSKRSCEFFINGFHLRFVEGLSRDELDEEKNNTKIHNGWSPFCCMLLSWFLSFTQTWGEKMKIYRKVFFLFVVINLETKLVRHFITFST